MPNAQRPMTREFKNPNCQDVTGGGPSGSTAVELSELRQTWSAEFIPLPADLRVPRGSGLKSALLNSTAVPSGPFEIRHWSFFGPWSSVISHSLVLGQFACAALVLFLSHAAVAKDTTASESSAPVQSLEFQLQISNPKESVPTLRLRGKDARQQLLLTAKLESGDL